MLMHDFVLRELKNTNTEEELRRVGFDKSYANRAVKKFEYKNIKIYSLTPAQANILKQTAISVGADCATHREVITGSIEKSNCILGGSTSEIKKIAEKLKFQPFGLKELGEKLIFLTDGGPKSNNICKIVGILNLTDNSFSDGGMYNDFEKAIVTAVNHDGDSDSTGSITGNIIGAHLGLSAIPEKFIANLELKNIIIEIADDLFHDWEIDDYIDVQDPDWKDKYFHNKIPSGRQ